MIQDFQGQQMETCRVTDLAGKKKQATFMQSTENGVTRREKGDLFLLDLSTTQMQISGVGQPAHPPNNRNQDVA